MFYDSENFDHEINDDGPRTERTRQGNLLRSVRSSLQKTSRKSRAECSGVCRFDWSRNKYGLFLGKCVTSTKYRRPSENCESFEPQENSGLASERVNILYFLCNAPLTAYYTFCITASVTFSVRKHTQLEKSPRNRFLAARTSPGAVGAGFLFLKGQIHEQAVRTQDEVRPVYRHARRQRSAGNRIADGSKGRIAFVSDPELFRAGGQPPLYQCRFCKM